MSQQFPSQAPVVIIGGGICGVSTLYHLAKRGVAAVLIERKQLASGTTWHAAGIVGQLRDSAAQTELGKYTAKLFQELEVETGQGTGYKQNGTINLALSDMRHEQLLRSHDHATRVGIGSAMMSAEEVQEKWPWIRVDDVLSGFHVPYNGQVNPLDVTVAMAKGAKANGAMIFENTMVTDLHVEQGVVRGVHTDKGYIETGKVVLAAGMWSHQFAKRYGVSVPLHACEHFYIVTEPMADLPSDQPILNIAEERTYWKEDAGKLLIGGFENQGKAWAQEGIPESFEFDQLPFDLEHVEPELMAMFERMPCLADMGIQTYFNGPESFTPDGRPYLGPCIEVPGLYMATGMNSNGILNSGGVGLCMAQWLIDGAPSRSMSALAANRIQQFQQNTHYNQERAAESVGFHYGLHWAGRQVTSARGVRRVPVHDRLVAAGAKFVERAGWEMPMYYDEGTDEWPQRASIGWQDWSEKVREESLAAQDAVVLLDQSMYAKFVIQGAEAVAALNYVCGAQMDVAVGMSVYAQMLNEQGGIEADVTVIRLATDQFMMISGHPSQRRDMQWLQDKIPTNLQAQVFDATSAYSLMTLHGPNARSLLQALSQDDLSAEQIPFAAAKEVDLHYARVTLIRRSFLGESGFELLMPTEFTASVYDAINAIGADYGLRHMGMFAMGACRLEKGFRHLGHDIDEMDTPKDSGLMFAVDMEKADFIGKQAIVKQLQQTQGPAYRLVGVMIDGLTAEQGPYLIHNEPLWQDGKCIGHITSGGFGFRLNKMLGLASVEIEVADKAWLTRGGFSVQIAGQYYPAQVQLKPFYDPSGARMRA
jgi:4-methylaminobutanoate oxidase (formaldehyde-forming)